MALKGRQRRPPLPLGGRGAKRGGCESAAKPDRARRSAASTVWLFDLDNTLHDASGAAFDEMHVAIGDYVVRHLGVDAEEADALRRRYWLRYGATMLGLVRHHGIRAAHFLEETHRMPGLETRLRANAPDRAALSRLPGRKYILTNAPRAYAMRVLNALDLTRRFDGVITIEDMTMFGMPRPKPDARMFRRLVARLGVPATRCILVEDTLQHLKSARSLGMYTVWMQRWLGGDATGLLHREKSRAATGKNERRRGHKPAYVCARISSLRKLAPAQ